MLSNTQLTKKNKVDKITSKCNHKTGNTKDVSRNIDNYIDC